MTQYADDVHRAQAEAFMLEIGRFAIEFERVCEAMRYTAIAIFYAEGLRHQGLAEVVIGDTASADLQQLVGALFSELRAKFNDDDRKAVKNLLKDVKELTERRNEVLHSAWRLGSAAREFEMMAVATRPTTAQNKGAVPQSHGLTTGFLVELSERARRIQLLLDKLQGCILNEGRSPAFELSQ